MPRRISVPILLSAVIVLAVAPAGGLAKAKKKKPAKLGPVVTVTESQTVMPGATVTATASCPARTNLVGGGLRATEVAGTVSIFVGASHRSGGAAWAVTGASSTGSGQPGTVTAYAYCRAGAPVLTEATGTGSLPAAGGDVGRGSATATCPGKLKPVAGGFSGPIKVQPPAQIFTIESSRRSADGKGWIFKAANFTGSVLQATAYAYCGPTAAVERSASAPGPGAIQSVATEATGCGKTKGRKANKRKHRKAVKPRALIPLAGGFELPQFVMPPQAVNQVSESARTALGWRTSTLYGGPNTAPITSLAYCG